MQECWSIQFINHIQDSLIASLTVPPPLSDLTQPRRSLRIFRVVQILAALLAGPLVLKTFHTIEIPINSLVILGQHLGKFLLGGAVLSSRRSLIPKPRDTFSFIIHDFMLERKYFKGSATLLVEKLKMQFGVEIPSNKITQNLVQHGIELKSFGVTFEIKRSCGQRFLILKYDQKSDSSDGCSLWVELAVTAVTPYLANALLMRFDDSDGCSESNGTALKQ